MSIALRISARARRRSAEVPEGYLHESSKCARTATDCFCQAVQLRLVEDGVASDAAPSDRRFAVDLDPFECGSSVGASETPGHLPDTGCTLDSLHP
jgi:hypothetical protein